MNTLRTLFARLVIFFFSKAWRAGEKLTGRRFPENAHYYLLKFFGLFGSAFPVRFSYPSPLDSNQRVTLQLDLLKNNELWIFRRGTSYDAELIRELASGLQKGAEGFGDIGANVGVYTIPLALKFRDRKMVAVEPFPPNLASLRKNIELNGLTNVEVFPGVVSSTSGPATFFINPLNEGGGSVNRFDDYRTGDVSINVDAYRNSHPDFRPDLTVPSTPLDQLIPSGRVALKIDTEGSEFDVLSSGENLFLSQRVVCLVVEVTNETIGPVLTFTDRHGIACFRFANGARERVPVGTPAARRIVNLFGWAEKTAVLS